MFITQGIANRHLLSREDNPIKPIGDLTTLRIMEVLFDEQYKELARQYQFCEEQSIYIPGFGRFVVVNSPLRKYIRDGVKFLRKLRKRIEKQKEDPNFNPDNSMTIAMERDLVLKVRVAWKQLDSMRHQWLNNLAVWNNKKSIKARMSIISDNVNKNE